jgi:hypothetical protein
MHIYTAAVYSNSYMRGQDRYEKLNDQERDVVHNLPHILESYHYVGKQRFVDDMRRESAKIFLDSGAFSAWTLGVKLSVEEYCEYIKRNLDIIRVEDGALMASVLDSIGGNEKSAEGTYRNQLEMEARGVRPLPCFHKGEPEAALEYYVHNYDYITLGGMVGTSAAQLEVWLDRIWEKYLTDGLGNPRCKVHGFGMTSIPLMERYPWYSCDSSSWIQAAAFGSVMTPQHGPIKVSDKSPSRHDRGQHITTLTELETNYLFQLLEKQGFTYERLSTIYESRAAYNLWAFGVINATINASHSLTFRARIQELF